MRPVLIEYTTDVVKGTLHPSRFDCGGILVGSDFYNCARTQQRRELLSAMMSQSDRRGAAVGVAEGQRRR